MAVRVFYGGFVKRKGDTMTGALIIQRDVATPTDGFLRLRRKSAGGANMVITFERETGEVRAVIRTNSVGDLFLSPKRGYCLNTPYSDVGAPPYWRIFDFPDRIIPRRLIMVESRLFGRR